MIREASLLTGPYATRTTRTASCCSTADRGRFLLHRKTDDRLSSGIQPSGRCRGTGKIRQNDTGAFRRRQRRVLPAAWKCKRCRGTLHEGTYVWVEVQNLKRLEAKIVEGPYIHHCVGIHENVVPVLYEACKYIGIAPDLYDPIEEDVKAYLRGE